MNPVPMVRQLRTADGPAVRELHDDLSERDTYLRFFTLRPARLPQFVDRLVSDVARRAAIGAFVDDRLVGVASYEVASNSVSADIAVVVAHRAQTQGIGTILLRDLVSLAQAAGLRRFTAEVLVENTAMLRVLRDCGRPSTVTRAGSVNHVVVELDAAWAADA
ncbi:GNAT family N-acetyltransferase [Kutzneria sp. 744]|uniref:GNAT family N-acetyltransferase n=1 Tax=Kutzneria sp. (strain 744) TaxID=345341 RepID=UPI0003EED477|nr:GNAT family N-acetyltransferase [Kutzneria sp. 744]EWM12132.1 acetyltransferase, GNAT family [Kutzneria sp. 744]